VTPKSIGFLCCPGQMCGQSLRKVGQSVLDLLIGNKKVTDAKQYAISSTKGGIIRAIQTCSNNER